ncbi:6-hydroxymethylpterin diphosphokinase MptE-like protein [Fervidibacillus albus]|uniref:DUF115 domain-containing protein n=1 Tax=Fervidibacillus albus TaxID=2980026 RepID=A0A9E8RW04_9BACI|nr:6-hydroxymethylpterin diphosphokinase MptE-like protein [Fervidibacillus albus]WAA09794.1 DUF115 domain-containing protein [Fervidibacillus albus]
MIFKVYNAKNGEKTLKVNDIQIYSKYSPSADATRFIEAEYDGTKSGYLLIGLGLGYHLKSLVELANGKKIFVYYFSDDEFRLFEKYNQYNWWKRDNIRFLNHIHVNELMDNVQVLIPSPWLKAIGQKHPLFHYLEVIKIHQISYKKNSNLLKENFYLNIALNDDSITYKRQSNIACLVAAGPSLNETAKWLVNKEKVVDIYAVGAALKPLLTNHIIPKAVVLSDPSDLTFQQFENIEYNGTLYYLSTANHKSVKYHKGPRIILFQQGYHLAEKQAKLKNAPLIETGGSVGTTTFSLLENSGYKQIVLFGQDLGFYGNQTHTNHSTSNQIITNDLFLRNEIANDGSSIYTNAMFQSFKFWYNQKMINTKVKVFNTAAKGAKINNVPLINEQQFQELLNGDML